MVSGNAKCRLVIILMILQIVLPAVRTRGQTQTSSQPIRRLTFTPDQLPPSLFNLYTGDDTAPYLSYRLPAGYSKDKRYPLILYVPGFHGNAGGTIQNAIDIAGNRDCVVASLPLFKKDIDADEPAGGVLVSFSDYPVISRGYRVMLEKLFTEVPNIDSEQSAIAGFSNGAITVAVLVSLQDEFILKHFHHFCMVDHGMFHLGDLHKSPSRDRRFLILVGDQEDFGRGLKLRGARLLEDSWQALNVDIESRVLTNTGHELTVDAKQQIGEWVFPGSKSAQEVKP